MKEKNSQRIMREMYFKELLIGEVLTTYTFRNANKNSQLMGNLVINQHLKKQKQLV